MSKVISPIVIVPIVFVVAILWQTTLNKNFDYECEKCGATFTLPALKGVLVPHSMGRKLVTCPKCGARTWARPVHKEQ
jgi:DNA-directed RNA polymerase subunit RPC12/RpoP